MIDINNLNKVYIETQYESKLIFIPYQLTKWSPMFIYCIWEYSGCNYQMIKFKNFIRHGF